MKIHFSQKDVGDNYLVKKLGHFDIDYHKQ